MAKRNFIAHDTVNCATPTCMAIFKTKIGSHQALCPECRKDPKKDVFYVPRYNGVHTKEEDPEKDD